MFFGIPLLLLLFCVSSLVNDIDIQSIYMYMCASVINESYAKGKIARRHRRPVTYFFGYDATMMRWHDGNAAAVLLVGIFIKAYCLVMYAQYYLYTDNK